MCSYPSDGGPTGGPGAGSDSCENARIMTALAKGTLSFPGFFISDEGAVTAPHNATSFVAGCDTYLGAGPNSADFARWLHDGEVSAARLDDAARRTLMPRFLLGEFDNPATVPWWDHDSGCGVVGAPEGLSSNA